MSEKVTKRSRKSKLLPRVCVDNEDDVSQMQSMARSSEKSKNIVVGSPPIKFSVNIEVEEFSEDIVDYDKVEGIKVEDCNSNDSFSIKSQESQDSIGDEIHGDDKNSLLNDDNNHSNDDNTLEIDDNTQSTDSTHGNDNTCGDDSSSDDDIYISDDIALNSNDDSQSSSTKGGKKSNGKPKTLLNSIYNTSQQSARSVKQCKITEESFFKELEKLSLKRYKLNKAERILEIEARNSWGRVAVSLPSSSWIEKQIQNVLEEWRSWASASFVRCEPLMYKCYICHQAWWHLDEFRTHLQLKHECDGVSCSLEVNCHESNIIAFVGEEPEFADIATDTDCWRCGFDYEFHRRNSKHSDVLYHCKYCQSKFFTCKTHVEHLSSCLEYKKFMKKNNTHKDDVIEFYRCFICKLVLTSKLILRGHYHNYHDVRSDLPLPIFTKNCSLCCGAYVNKSFHRCPKKIHSLICTHCLQRFPTKIMKDLHEQDSAKDYKCRVCSEVLPSKCMEFIHVSRHTAKFRLLYKCLSCEENIFLLNETSMKQHVVIWHRKKFDKRRNLVEVVVVPSQCVTSKIIQQLDIVASLSGKFEIVAKQNKNGVLEVSRLRNLADLYKKKRVEKPNKLNKATVSKAESDDDDFKIKIIENCNYDINDDVENNVTRDDSVDKTIEDQSNDIKLDAVDGNINSDVINNAFPFVIQNIKSEKVNDANDKIKNDKAASDEIINKEKLSSIKLEKDDDIEETIQEVNYIMDKVIKQEPGLEQTSTSNAETDDYATLLSKVFGGSHCFAATSTTNIKQELSDDDFYEDDIIIWNEKDQTVEMSSPEKTKEVVVKLEKIDVSPEKTKKKTNKAKTTVKAVNVKLKSKPVKRKITQVESKPSTSKIKVFNNKRKKCNNCKAVGSTFESIKHISNCGSNYTCTKCNNEFESIQEYAEHFPEHGFPTNTCPACNMTLSKKTNFPVHLQLHMKQSFMKVQILDKKEKVAHIDLLYTCKECKENVDIELLFEHWEKHLDLNVPLLKTEECDDVQTSGLDRNLLYEIKARLMSSSSVSVSENKKCVGCSREFSRKNDLKRHLIEHLLMDALSCYTLRNGLVCQICGLELDKSDPFRKHLRDHAALPVYSCHICSRSFSDSSNFAKHRKTHNFKNIHECKLCHKRFHSVHKLMAHEAAHIDTQPITCKSCDKIFYEESMYRRHMRYRHLENGSPRFACMICREKFGTLKEKWDHSWAVHKQRKQHADCPLCNEPFRKYQDVRIHMREKHDKKITLIPMQKMLKIVKLASSDEDAAAGNKGKGKDEMCMVFDDEDNNLSEKSDE